jgi:hypothetical protein
MSSRMRRRIHACAEAIKRQVTHACYIRRRIHACHMRRRIHACAEAIKRQVTHDVDDFEAT